MQRLKIQKLPAFSVCWLQVKKNNKTGVTKSLKNALLIMIKLSMSLIKESKPE